jgi:hypothetical protein
VGEDLLDDRVSADEQAARRPRDFTAGNWQILLPVAQPAPITLVGVGYGLWVYLERSR